MKFKSLLIFIITILAAASNISFGMKAPDKIIIQCKDQSIELDNTERTKDKSGLGDILQTSQTIKNMFESFGLEEQLKNGSKLTINDPVPFPNMTCEDFKFAYEYMSLIAENKKKEIRGELIKLDLETLCQRSSALNYLDIKAKDNEQKDFSLLDKHLILCMAYKFDYKNENHYECIENIDLPDQKKILAKNIAEKLSLTTIPLLVCLYQDNKDKQLVSHISSHPFILIQKGDWRVAGHKNGDVIVRLPDSDSYRKIIWNYCALVYCVLMNKYEHSIGRGRRLGRHNQDIESLALHSTKKFLVSADKTTVRLWDLNTFRCIRIFWRDVQGDFDAASIRFNDAGDKIISGPDANNPLSLWELHDPYEVVKKLNALKAKLSGKNSFFDNIWKSIPDDTIAWPQRLWNNKFLISGGLAACALLYYKRDAVLSYLIEAFISVLTAAI